MKRKALTKKSLEELAQVMPVLSEKEQSTLIGGTGSFVTILDDIYKKWDTYNGDTHIASNELMQKFENPNSLIEEINTSLSKLGDFFDDIKSEKLSPVLIETIKNCMSYTGQSSVEIEAFDKYATGGSGMSFSSQEENEIFDYATKQFNRSKSKPVTIKDKTYYEMEVSFYNNSKYNYVFGTATVYFDQNGNAVGLTDKYDFNTDADRGAVSQAITTSINILTRTGWLPKAKAYDISIGITPSK